MANNITHIFHIPSVGSEYNEAIQDHVYTAINYYVISTDTSRMVPGSDYHVHVYHSGTLVLDPPTQTNFISHAKISEQGIGSNKYFRQWVDSKVDIIAIQNENVAKLNATP